MSCASVEKSLVLLGRTIHLIQNRKAIRTVATTIHKMGTGALRNMNSGTCFDGHDVRRPCLRVPCAQSVSHCQLNNSRCCRTIWNGRTCSGRRLVSGFLGRSIPSPECISSRRTSGGALVATGWPIKKLFSLNKAGAYFFNVAVSHCTMYDAPISSAYTRKSSTVVGCVMCVVFTH